MKRLILSAAAILFIATTVLSQAPQRRSAGERERTPDQEQEVKQTPGANEHGRNVSETARKGGSGEAVRQQAHTQRDRKRIEREERRAPQVRQREERNAQKRQQEGTRVEQPDRPQQPENVSPNRPNNQERPQGGNRPARPARP